MSYRFFVCDVFTDTRFGGNQLAVLPEAEGLSGAQMQQVAREFNFSESTFVLPSEAHTRQVRIFTPTTEVPFAGHPNVGTAFALASKGLLGAIEDTAEVTFEEKAGLVPMTIRRTDSGSFWCELHAPEPLSFGESVTVEELAAAVSLEPGDIVTSTHGPVEASVGLRFLFAELASRDALERARTNMSGLDEIVRRGVTPDIHLYVRSDDAFDIRARMFAPLDGVLEDPATGSANCALVGLLSHHNDDASGDFSFRIAQGVEMGRPSVLEARTAKRDGTVSDVWIGGTSVMVAEGTIDVS